MRRKKLFLGILVLCIIVMTGTGILLAAPNINLSIGTNQNTANLSWVNNDSVKSYNYDVKKSVNGSEFKSLNENDGNKVNVLNIYPDSSSVNENVTFTTYDGETVTIKKSASLKQWMECSNSDDSRGYGRGLIEVTPVSITEFNNNPSAYLYKDSNGKYNCQVVVFGTWDSYGSQDLSSTSAEVMRQYLADGNSCVMGHDTIRGDANRGANFASLRSYFNIKTALDDGVTNVQGQDPGNINGNNSANPTTQVTLRTNNVFTTYPWNIGSAGTILTVPHCHCVQQVAYGNVEITFTSTGDITDQYGQGNWNYYLTVNNNAAMIQTGHSNCEATPDEQKIWANLLFYLGDVNTETTAVDNDFKDIDAPDKPTVTNNNLNGLNGTVEYTAKDNGTTYNYYVEASERTTLEKTTSNTVEAVNTSGVAGYSYVVDNNENTEPDNTIDTSNTSINYTIGNGPKTYLHIKTIDAAGNVSGVTHVLLYTNIGPELVLSQNPTEWTNKDVTINAVGSDVDGKVISIKKPDGTTVNSDTTQYVVPVNGTYEFTATDNSGATVTESITITNIDKVKPQGSGTVVQPTSQNRYATIKFNATDDASGVAKIVLPDNSEVTTSTTNYNVTEPGTYTFKIYDVAGNENTVNVNVTIPSDGLEVKYIDQVTKEEIATSVEKEGNIGDSYKTEEKEISGYELVNVIGNTTGTLTMDKITVTYEYRKLSDVTVKYVDENTGKEIPGVDNVVTTYKEGDAYTTEKKNIEGYEYTRDSGNTEGEVGRENIEVVYYYKKTAGGVEVKYIDQVTGEEIATSETLTGLEKDPYETEAKEVSGYKLVLTPINASGEMTVEKITVTYEYRKLSDVTVKYVDENTGKEIPEVDNVVTTYKEGDAYTTEKKNIEGYEYTRDSGNTEGEVGRENIEVVYYYKKIAGGVEVKYIDQVTGEEIVTGQTLTGLEKDPYETQAKEVSGYELVLTPSNASGEMTVEKITVTYEYRKLSDVTTRYIDVNTGDNITGEIIETYKQGDKYTTEEKGFEGYKMVSKSNNTEGTVEREDIEVVYYYKKISSGVEVRYIDQVTNEIIYPTENITGLEKDYYETQAKEIDGYELVVRPENAIGHMTVDKIVVTYGYRKLSDVTVKYIDANTGKSIIDDIVTRYKEGDRYQTEEKILGGYELVSKTDNTSGEVGREDIEVVYEYKKISAGVEVKYIDQVTGQEIAEREEMSGLERDPYETEAKEIEGYELVVIPSNANGEMTVEKIEVVYEYRKTANVIIKHIDGNTGESIIKDVVTKYKEGDKYEALGQAIEGYTITKEPENKTGEVGREDIIVVYEYKKISEGLVVKYVDEITNEIMDTEEYTGNENDVIKLEDKAFNGYILTKRPEEKEVSLTVEPQERTFYYRKIVNITIVGIDANTKEEIYTKVQTGIEGNEYQTIPEEIPGYEVSKVPENAQGTYTREETKVVYEYKKISGGVKVSYIDKETGEVLKEYRIDGLVGDKYKTEKEEIEKYNYVGVEGEERGELEEKEKEVKYYYEKKRGIVEVIYVDEEGKELYKEEMEGKVDEEYKVEEKEIENYRIKERPENAQGVYEEGRIVVKYVMERIRGTVVVNLIDDEGNIMETINGEGYAGDIYELEIPEKEGYEIVGEKFVKVEIVEGEQVINVYYRKIEEAPQTGDINVYMYIVTLGVCGYVISKIFKRKIN